MRACRDGGIGVTLWVVVIFPKYFGDLGVCSVIYPRQFEPDSPWPAPAGVGRDPPVGV